MSPVAPIRPVETGRPFFVYGTLRRGQANHRLLRGWTVAEHPAELAGFALHATGIPYVVPAAPTDRVVGELLFIRPGLHEEVLTALDRLEGFQPGGRRHYERLVAPARYGTGGQEQAVEAWVYVAGPWFVPSTASLVASGDWLDARTLRPALR